jgi:hypothetical protein
MTFLIDFDIFRQLQNHRTEIHRIAFDNQWIPSLIDTLKTQQWCSKKKKVQTNGNNQNYWTEIGSGISSQPNMPSV